MANRIETRNAAMVRHFLAGKSTAWLSKRFKLGLRSVQRIVKPYRNRL